MAPVRVRPNPVASGVPQKVIHGGAAPALKVIVAQGRDLCQASWSGFLRIESPRRMFGELRPPNAMFLWSECFLAHFDWTGRNGVMFCKSEPVQGTTNFTKQNVFVQMIVSLYYALLSAHRTNEAERATRTK